MTLFSSLLYLTLVKTHLRIVSFLCLGICLATSCVAQESVDSVKATGPLKTMFNASDLGGWVRTNTPPETWTLRDDVLYCTGKPIGELRTDRMYQNFIMELEWRHMVPGGNAGIFVWADDIPARGVPFHRGIEVQVLENSYGNTQSHTTHGDIFPIHGAKLTPINGRGGDRAFPTDSLSKPSPQWNHYRIECRDGEIELSVNGELVTRGKDAVPRKGYICLESEGGKVEYRNVRIAELSASELPSELIAIQDRGYQSIYSGLDLRGWTATPTLDDWHAGNWVLSHKAGKEASVLRYESETVIERFVTDVRLSDVTSRATLILGPQVEIPLDAPEIATHLEDPGNWNRLEGIKVADGWNLSVNGQSLRMPVADNSARPQMLAVRAQGIVEFCNLFVAPRPAAN